MMKKPSRIPSLILFTVVIMLPGCLFPYWDDDGGGGRGGGHRDGGYRDGGHRDGGGRGGERR
ncbi:hypothetical protein [Geomesophilobacter sediminis]|uniref:Uncharacterized protein n=1 Tax=Geomesophilobacter sediminis TaxID=2798584 RepID=A0A8J7M0H6_9BACT|nr:hypothetical protein [Geomesophilobacter sediminis]MBJ6725232.1 hypothetical protein [Geomesophilobacter sediminis]